MREKLVYITTGEQKINTKQQNITYKNTLKEQQSQIVGLFCCSKIFLFLKTKN